MMVDAMQGGSKSDVPRFWKWPAQALSGHRSVQALLMGGATPELSKANRAWLVTTAASRRHLPHMA
jgi:hypothetical protein